MGAEKSKKYTLRFRAINQKTWQNIKTGRKTIETRAATVRYKDIKAGDVLVLVCGKNRFEKRIKTVRKFKTVEDMLKKCKLKDVEPEAKSVEDLKAAYYSYPKYKEKIKKFGLVVLELK
jgi:ASC-1-like (ASCH) protein